MMSDVALTEFLLARIADDEAAARSAIQGSWRYESSNHDLAEGMGNIYADEADEADGYTLSVVMDNDREEGVGATDVATAAHITRHAPRRVLAECEAKRRIVEIHTDGAAPYQWEGDDDPSPSWCTVCHDYERHDAAEWPCATLRLLALPYADHHPEYRDEWRPA